MKMFNVNAEYVVVHKCTFVFVCVYTLFQGLKLLGKHIVMNVASTIVALKMCFCVS